MNCAQIFELIDLEIKLQKIKEVKSGQDFIRALGLTDIRGLSLEMNAFIKDNEVDISHWIGQVHRNRVHKKRDMKTILVENSDFHPGHLKKRLIAEGYLEYKCACCGISDWEGKPLSLQLNHISGVKHDCRIENLELLCPLCHANTSTFRGRNIKK